MKKEQMTIRLFPILKINLERKKDKSNCANLNDYIVKVLENHIANEQSDEQITVTITKLIDEQGEKSNQNSKEIANLMNWNKTILAKILNKLNIAE